MGKRIVRMPYTTFAVGSKVNPATVRRIVEPFIESYPSGEGFNARAAFRALEQRGYAVERMAADGAPIPFQGTCHRVTRRRPVPG